MDKEQAIKELMGLVYEYSKYERWYYEALQTDVGVRNAGRQCNIVEDALKVKLCELLERKTLTDEQIAEATNCEIDDPVFIIFKGVVQAVERYNPK